MSCGARHSLYFVPRGQRIEKCLGGGRHSTTSTRLLPNPALQPTPGDRRGPSEARGAGKAVMMQLLRLFKKRAKKA